MPTNNYIQKLLLSLSLFLVIWIGITQAWNWLTASPWDTLNTSKWNQLVNKVAPVYSVWGDTWNVWVWDSSPDHKLDVAGNIGLNASSYINFWDTDGTTWYWLRDNAGTIQYKNSGGSWSPLAMASWWDNLWNHTAGQNIALDTFWLSGDGDNEGIAVDPDGNVNSWPMSIAWDLSLKLWLDYTTVGSANNVALGWGTGSTVRFNAVWNSVITGISGWKNGKILNIMNVTDSFFMTLVHDSASSLIGNRILTKNSQNLSIAPWQTVRLQYDSIDSKWRIIDASPMKYVYQTTSDQTRSINSYAAIPWLTTWVLPVGSYRFQFIWAFRTNNATSGAGFSLVQNTATLAWYIAQAKLQSTATANYEVSITSATAPTHFSPNASTTLDYFAEVEGIFQVTSEGTVEMRMRPETNGRILTLRAGATLIIQQLN